MGAGKEKIQSFGIIIKKADYILAILKGMKMLYQWKVIYLKYLIY